MRFFKKHMIRLVFCLSLLIVSIQMVGDVFAAAKYRDDLPVPFSQIKWDHTDVSGWKINSDLHEVYISGGQINMPHTMACDWPMLDAAVNANAWVIHKSTRDGLWHANTWDFMRKCQTVKGEHDVGDPYGWRPSYGEVVYILMSGIARPGYAQTIQARSNIVKYIWGSGVGKALPAVPACTGPPAVTKFEANPTGTFLGGLVKFDWEVSDAEGLTLTRDDGASASIDQYDPFVQGVEFYPEGTATYTLVATNACGSSSPMSVKVSVVESISFINQLLLYPGATVTTKSADNVTGVSATLHGEVSFPGDSEATVFFEYGSTVNYGTVVSGNPVKVSGSAVAVEGVVGSPGNPLTSGMTYHYRVKAVVKNKTTYGADGTFITDNVPAATTGTQTNLTDTTVTLNATVNPNGAETTVTFEYGETDQYGMTAAGGTITGSTAQVVSVDVTGLISDRTYHFRVKAENNVGPAEYGGDRVFITPDQPAVTTEDATDVLETSMTLTGTVDPKGSNTTVTFEYGSGTGYGTVVDGTPSVISSTGSSTYALTGLTRGTTIHYRIVGQNDYGTVNGSDKVFTTDNLPVSVTGVATDVTINSATGTGTVTANGAVTTVSCQAGSQSGSYYFGYTVNESPIAENAVDAPVTCNFSNLTSGTTYYYVIRSTNDVGSHDGVEQSFTTLLN